MQKQLPDAFKRGTRMLKEARGLDERNSNTTSTSTSAEASASSSMSAASKTSSSATEAAAATTSSRSIDSHHYWYIEDSPDQARWRKSPPTAASSSSSAEGSKKRALGHFFDNLQDEFDRKSGQVSSSTVAGSAPTGFSKLFAYPFPSIDGGGCSRSTAF